MTEREQTARTNMEEDAQGPVSGSEFSLALLWLSGFTKRNTGSVATVKWEAVCAAEVSEVYCIDAVGMKLLKENLTLN